MNDLGWLKNLRNRLNMFIQSMGNDDYSYFKYSYSGDFYDSRKRWGLANTVFATKLLYITGLLKDTPDEKQANMYKAIVKFTGRDGAISDPVISEMRIREKRKATTGMLPREKSKMAEDIKRAETRQSFRL